MERKNQYLPVLCCCIALLMLWPQTGSGADPQDGSETGQQFTYSAMEQARLGDEMARYGFTEKQRLRFREMVRNTHRLGIPDAPLQEKVQEGMAKGYDGEVIIGAVEQVANRYRNAYRHVRTLGLDDDTSQPLGNALAQAYAAGLQDEDMTPVMTRLRERLAAMDEEERYELALQVMVTARETARRQIRSDAVCQQLNEALRLSYGADEIEAMRHRYEVQARYRTEQGPSAGSGGGNGRDADNGRNGGDTDNGRNGGSDSGGSNGGSSGQGGSGSSNSTDGSSSQGGSNSSGSGGQAGGSGQGSGSSDGGSGSGGSGKGGGGRG